MATNHQSPVAFVTGAAQRVGAAIARALHQQGYDLIIHYRHSRATAEALRDQLNAQRPNSAVCLAADFNDMTAIAELANASFAAWQRIDLLINNASEYFTTPLGSTSMQDWQRLYNSNVTGPYFLTQALLPALSESQGCVINLLDKNLESQRPEYNVYCMAKAGLKMMTLSLAKALAPTIRVNGVALGETLPPIDQLSNNLEAENPQAFNEITQAITFLINNRLLTGIIIETNDFFQ